MNQSSHGTRVIAAAGLLLLLAVPAMASPDLSGTWSFEVSLGDGQGGTAIITLVEGEGGELSGTYSGALGEEPIDGQLNDKDVQLSFRSDAGNVSFHGEVKEDGSIEGTCSYGQLGDGTFVAKKKQE